MVMKAENVNVLKDTLKILDQGFYTLGGKRIPLKPTPSQMHEISVYLPKDVQEISRKKDFPHVHVMGRVGVGCENMDSFSLARKRKEDTAFLLQKDAKPVLVLNLANPVNPGGGVRQGSAGEPDPPGPGGRIDPWLGRTGAGGRA